MKKFWTNLLCLLLALSMVFCLCACGDEGYVEEDDDDEETTESTDGTGDPTDPANDPTDPANDPTDPVTPGNPSANPLVGNWEWNMDMTEQLNTMLAQTELGSFVTLTDLAFLVKFEIKEDGTYKMYVDQAEIQSKTEKVKQDFKAGYPNYIEAVLAANNMNMTVEEFLLAYNMSMDTEAEKFASGIMTSFNEMDETGIYKVENGKLYITEDTTFDEEDGRPYTLEGNNLTVICPEESPWETMDFVRVN